MTNDNPAVFIQKVFPNAIVEKVENKPFGFKIKSELSDLQNVMERLYQNESLHFDHLSSIIAVDNGPQTNTMEILYFLFSYTKIVSVCVSCVLPNRDKPNVPSLSYLWRSADWHEREIFDLFGIVFENHPDLRRILLPANWEGNPLRKDYNQQEYYHGIKVKY